jgi:SAM-dependent methyltransferase
MGIIGGSLGYHLLRTITRNGVPNHLDGSAYRNSSKLEVLLGARFWEEIEGKVVVDFGCGRGADSVEMAQRGARKVIGVDIQERFLAAARERATEAGVDDRCSFVTATDERADVIVAVDSFEHFADPAAILNIMYRLVKADGCLIACFGPTWYHPYGGHLFSIFPWSHLIFTETALIRWRADITSDGATRFSEVEGGLNRMSIRCFERIVSDSPFDFASFEAVPIRRMRFMSNRLTREFTTAVVRCKLIPRS